MSRRGYAGAVLVGVALALPTGTAIAQDLPTESGCPQDPRICQSGVTSDDPPTDGIDEDSNATAYTLVGVGAGVALLAGGVVAARRRHSATGA